MNLEHFEKALKRRSEILANLSVTNAYRFFCGKKEGVPGLVIDVYDRVGIFQFHEGKCKLTEAELGSAANWCGTNLKLESIYFKKFIQDRSHARENPELQAHEPFWGEPSEPEIEILENGLKYWIHPYDGYSTGLFLDQRLNRAFLGKQTKGKVLNCFSYTCGFSVACAKNGAEVTSVDVSRKYLDWGKRNFQLNALDPEKHRFMVSDTFEAFKRLQKKGEKFSLIILDPPSFGRSDAGVFSLEKDYQKLLLEAKELLEEKGLLFFSSNFSEWDSTILKRKIFSVLEKHAEAELPEVPADFRLNESFLSQVLVRQV